MLLNIDYKALAKILANRMQAVLPKLIHPDQTGFMKSRYIGTNVRKLLDIIEYSEQMNEANLAIYIDTEKAFDSIEHSAIKKAFQYFNISSLFFAWIEILLKQLCFSLGSKFC